MMLTIHIPQESQAEARALLLRAHKAGFIAVKLTDPKWVTMRATWPCPVCDGKGALWQNSRGQQGECYACLGYGYTTQEPTDA